MCGIFGYLGSGNAVPVLLDGLKRLEYRGYDSAGVAVLTRDETISVRRASGKIANLEEQLQEHPTGGSYGIGHTRWATHGRPTEANAHPQTDCAGRVAVVHNGIVENYSELRAELECEGHSFRSETDTEVIAHLIEKYECGDLSKAVHCAAARLRGVYAIAVVSSLDLNKIVVTRNGPPVVMGFGEGEFYIASDVAAILSYSQNLLFLGDGEMATVTGTGVRLTDYDGRTVQRGPLRVGWDPSMTSKGEFRHFMLKEIYEQPKAVRDTIAPRVQISSNRVSLDEFAGLPLPESIRIIACGTSWHAALAGKAMIESLARIPVEVDYGSEFRYRNPIVQKAGLTVAISQSGETADTLAGLLEAKQRGSTTLAVCNTPNSMLTREADATVLTHAGPEIGVASTKAFTCQLSVMALLALWLAQEKKTLPACEAAALLEELRVLPAKLQAVLALDGECRRLARTLERVTNALYLGRGLHFPVALEGALKLKEISYIHAEGYPAGEMKHGPNALIDDSLPVFVLAARDFHCERSRVCYEKTLSNIQEVKARSGIVVAVGCERDRAELEKVADHVLAIPGTHEILQPLLEVIPLQLFAYHAAVLRECDVDQPRNLAKSVTVE